MANNKTINEDLPPPLCSNENEHDDSDEENWEETEMEETTEPFQCLFCESTFNNVEIACKHLSDHHQVDFVSLKNKFKMDQYSYLMLINCIRTNKISPEELNNAKAVFWNDEKYLKPIREEDSAWLCYDFESSVVSTNNISNDNKVEHLERLIMTLKQQLEFASKDMETMKMSFNNLIENESKEVKRKFDENCVGGRDLDSDDGYFFSYSHFGIHRDMLSDKVRTDSYRDAILNNVDILKDKIVIDCGCGTSILSMFASQAGAKEIIAVDQSDIIYQAMDIARINKITNIKFIKGRIEDTELPVKKVDVIISEWMGYFLLFEGMLDSVIYARDYYLKPGGIVMPNRCTINFAAYGDLAGHKNYIEFWDNVYGYNFSSMKKDVLKEAVIEEAHDEFVMTDSVILLDLDLMNCAVFQNFSYDFSLKVKKTGGISSFIGYFDTFFDLPNPVSFSTSPSSTSTHWKQIHFYLEKPIFYSEGDIITGKFICKRDRKDVRSLTICIEAFGQTLKYCLN